MSQLRRSLKKVLPQFIYRPLKRRLDEKRWQKLSQARSRTDIFSMIYKDKMWGGSEDFYSGHGSSDTQIVVPYVAAVKQLLGSFDMPPSACDFGCGDFRVGQQIRPACAAYVGCDLVPELIARNQKRFKDLDVEFRVVDIVTDELPDGDVAFIREVLQHLSNEEIAAVLPKLAKYRYVVVTEVVPVGDFEPNLDKPAGFDIRASRGSGVDLQRGPFNFPVKASRVICEVPHLDSLMRTTAYEPA